MTADVALASNDSGKSATGDSMSSRDWRTIFKHRTAVSCLLLVVIHQSVVACSTIFLTNAISKFQANQAYFIDLSLYLVAMATPYLPGCASFVFLQRWINESHRALVNRFTATAILNRPDYRDHAMRENVTAVLARNSFPVLKDYISFVHDLASFSLNSFLSISVIVFLLPAQLAGGYCVSLVLCFVIVIGLQKAIAETSSRCEYAYLRYSGLLSGFWSNTALGNAYNESIWRSRRESTGNVFYAASNRLEVLRQSGNALLAAASLGPTIFLIVSIARNDAPEPALIAALIVSLTRIFLIINSLSTLVYRILDYSSLHARAKVLLDAMSDMARRTGETDIGPIDISVNGESVTDALQAKRQIVPNQCGRFTIMGANGSGKSTLLLALKREYGEQAYLLPSNYSDLAWETDCSPLSTGQALLEHLTEILKLQRVHCILLDEWDANLDTKNVEKIDKILSALSTTKVIVEVRHRRSL